MYPMAALFAGFTAQEAPAPLPALLETNEATLSKLRNERHRGGYGGKGEKAHLGGFTGIDPDGLSPAVWKWMLSNMTVRSVIDVGCGKGVSTSWFLTHGARVKCVEGSHDAVSQSLLPAEHIIEHDFSRGPWWPSETYDVAWSVEFLEHVGRNYMRNYMPIFKKAALLFVTHSTWGGWHHVEAHMPPYWRFKFESHGFVFSQELTDRARAIAKRSSMHPTPEELMPTGEAYRSTHLALKLLVFINPLVAGLPEHAHLMGGGDDAGCFRRHMPREYKPCTGADELPSEFKPLPLTAAQDAAWEKLVFRSNRGSRKGAKAKSSKVGRAHGVHA